MSDVNPPKRGEKISEQGNIAKDFSEYIENIS